MPPPHRPAAPARACSSELFSYTACVGYAVVAALVALDRVALREKVVDRWGARTAGRRAVVAVRAAAASRASHNTSRGGGVRSTACCSCMDAMHAARRRQLTQPHRQTQQRVAVPFPRGASTVLTHT